MIIGVSVDVFKGYREGDDLFKPYTQELCCLLKDPSQAKEKMAGHLC